MTSALQCLASLTRRDGLLFGVEFGGMKTLFCKGLRLLRPLFRERIERAGVRNMGENAVLLGQLDNSIEETLWP